MTCETEPVYGARWMMSGPNPITDTECKRMVEAGCTGVLLMLHHEGHRKRDGSILIGGALRRDDEIVVSLARARAYGLDIGVIVWWDGTPGHAESAARLVWALHERVGLDCIMHDFERIGMRQRRRHYDDALAVHDQLWTMPPTNGLRLPPLQVLAAYASPGPRSIALAACRTVDAVMHMGYGNARHSPSTLRALLPWLRRWLRAWRRHLRPNQALWHGQGAYDLHRPDASSESVLLAMAETAAEEGCETIAYWQLETMDTGSQEDRMLRGAMAQVAAWRRE